MVRWRKVAIIIKREYLSRIRTKAFWISTLAVPVLMGSFLILPGVLIERTGGSFRVAVLATAGKVFSELEGSLQETERGERGEAGALDVRLERIEPAANRAAQREELKRRLLANELDVIIVLPDDVLTEGRAEYLSQNVAAFRLMNRLANAVESAVMVARLAEAGVAADEIAAITRSVHLEAVRVGEGGSEERDAAERSFVLSYFMTFLLFMTMVFYGFYVLRGVLEEKSSRIVEVIVANLRPTELMLGKILGVGSVGLTQYAIWAVAAMNISAFGLLDPGAGSSSAGLLSPKLLAFFVIFFLLGFCQFASCYAAVGAIFNTEEEAQQMQTVVGIVLAIPMVLIFPILSNPDSTVSVVLSLVPLFAPILFFMRMSVQFPPTWQIILCLALLVASILTVGRFAAAIYRVGILMYGKRPTARQLWGWLRSP